MGEVSEHYFQGLSFVFGFVSYLRLGGGSRSGEALEPLGTAVPYDDSLKVGAAHGPRHPHMFLILFGALALQVRALVRMSIFSCLSLSLSLSLSVFLLFALRCWGNPNFPQFGFPLVFSWTRSRSSTRTPSTPSSSRSPSHVFCLGFVWFLRVLSKVVVVGRWWWGCLFAPSVLHSCFL